MRVIGLAGWSGSGKTTLLIRLIPCLVARGLTVSTLKHAHHGFDVDQPGKDSHSHRMAGATEVMVASAARFALIHELRGAADRVAGPAAADGAGRSDHCRRLQSGGRPELEVIARRWATAAASDDDCIVAVASDVPLPRVELPVVSLDEVGKITDIVALVSAPVERVLAAQGQS
jgi:molybdopterin-guanine dinucleotide biosynthesis protein B